MVVVIEPSHGRRVLAWAAVGIVVSALWSQPAFAQVVINELLADNGRTRFDEEGDAEDWVELLNLSEVDVDLDGHYLTDDTQEIEKWRFPSVTIPAGGYLTVWLSGKDRHVPPPEAIEGAGLDLAFEPNFIDRAASWRYLALAGEEPPAGWNERLFDDSGFATGTAGFGYGDGDDATIVPDQTPVVLIRREFTVADPAALRNLVLEIDFDDGFVAFLNGRRVAARNALLGPITGSSVATDKREAGTPERFDLTPHLDALVPGANVLAVAGLNDLPSSDMSLHPRLGIVPEVLHTSFRLDPDGEFLILTAPDGQTILDGLTVPPQTRDHSYGRQPDGVGEWRYLLTPTPEAPNDTLGFDEPIAALVEATPPGGRFDGPVDLVLSASPAGRLSIRYTIDGREPGPDDTPYIGPVRIAEDRVVRVAGFIDGERATETVSYSFFVTGSFTRRPIDLPILSISMDPDDFNTVQTQDGARGRGSERFGWFEWIDAAGIRQVATGFGLRLHGGAGRGGDFNTKKAYKAYFRSEYGESKLRYPLIPDTTVEVFDKLVLRGNFNDSFRTNGRASCIRDQLIRDLHREMGALASHGTWCNLYVNGQYRGVYNVVERMDEEFLSSYLEGDSWDVIKTGNDVLVGSGQGWSELRTFFVESDLSDEAVYEQALERIDIDSFTSYMLVNIWAQNQDWPHNNWYAARRRDPDGKWMFLCWDAEFGIGLIPSGWSSDTFEFVFGRSGNIRDIFDSLVRSPIFQGHLLAEAERHVDETLHPDNVVAHIRRLRDTIAVDMDDEMALFPQSISDWNRNVNDLESFARNRNSFFLGHLRSSPRLSGAIDVTPAITTVEPSTIVNDGDAVVTISGARFGLAPEVYFNGVPGEVVRATLGVRIEVRLPGSQDVSGPVAIRVENPTLGTRNEASGLLEVIYPVPRIDAIDPPSGGRAGGELVRISGEWFLEGVQVLFDGVESPEVVRVDGGSELLEVRTPPGDGTVTVRVVNVRPQRTESTSTATFEYTGQVFLRGDATADGEVDVSDAVAILGYLFTGGADPECLAAVDVDRSSIVELTDAVALLGYLFLGGLAPAQPFPDCGPDPLGDELACEAARACQ